MGFTHVTVSLKVPGSRNGVYEALFLVDTGATRFDGTGIRARKSRNPSGGQDDVRTC